MMISAYGSIIPDARLYSERGNFYAEVVEVAGSLVLLEYADGLTLWVGRELMRNLYVSLAVAEGE